MEKSIDMLYVARFREEAHHGLKWLSGENSQMTYKPLRDQAGDGEEAEENSEGAELGLVSRPAHKRRNTANSSMNELACSLTKALRESVLSREFYKALTKNYPRSYDRKALKTKQAYRNFICS